MKLTKMTILISLIICGTIATQTCKDVFNKESKTAVDISTVAQFYPADEAQEAKANAIKQTMAARKLFYSPNEKYLAIVKKAALNLINLYNASPENKDNFRKFIESDEQRQTKDSASAQELLKAAYSSRIISKLDKEKDKKDLAGLALLELMNNMKTSPKPTDILSFLGLCGDFAASIFDAFGGRQDKTPAKVELAQFFLKNYPDLKELVMTRYKSFSPDNYYNGSGQDKTTERYNCAEAPTKMVKKSVVRSGVLDTGAEVDATLKATQNSLPKLGWPWQTVPNKLKKYCSKEPWAGHFSGSFYELAFMLEFFATLDKNKPKLNSDAKTPAIAWASAFLIATGMHSSIEVAFPAMLMLEKIKDTKIVVEIDKDNKQKEALEALQKNLCDSSTQFTVDLHTAGTKSKRKLK
jgi:hypothetical protein